MADNPPKTGAESPVRSRETFPAGAFLYGVEGDSWLTV